MDPDERLYAHTEQRYARWQAENPTLTRATFNAKAWPVIREELVGHDAAVEDAKAKLRASSIYNI